MVEGYLGFMLDQILYFSDISLCLGLPVLVHVDLLGSQLGDKRVQREEVDILKMIIGAIMLLKLFWGLPGIDALHYAEPPKILEGELKFADGLGATDVLGDLSSLTWLDFPHYNNTIVENFNICY